MSRTAPELPGFVTVRGAGDRLRLAPRSVRDLIYTGRLPSTRLGRRHYLRAADVDLERRRRLGLPLPAARRAPRLARRRPSPTPTLHLLPDQGSTGEAVRAMPQRTGHPHQAPSPASAAARHARAEERAAFFERWLHSGHRPEAPDLPFEVVGLTQPATCDVCRRPVRAGNRMIGARAADGRGAARLCLSCGSRTILAWSDARRREAVAARRMAREVASAIPAPAATSVAA